MTSNENKIRLSGTANIPKPLELGKTYDVTIANVEVRKKEARINDDDTYDMIHNLVISETSEVNIISENDVVKASKKGSMSKVLKWELDKLAAILGEDTDDHYKKRMIGFIEQIKSEQA